jgi:hypothetical protein
VNKKRVIPETLAYLHDSEGKQFQPRILYPAKCSIQDSNTQFRTQIVKRTCKTRILKITRKESIAFQARGSSTRQRHES